MDLAGWRQLRAREALERRTDSINLNNHGEPPDPHSHLGWTLWTPCSPQAKLPTCCCFHHSSGFCIDNVTSSPNVFSASLSHRLPARRVCPELLLSVEPCPLPAVCQHQPLPACWKDRAQGPAALHHPWAVPAPLAAPSSLETHPRICYFSLQLIAHPLRGCCGVGPGGRGSISLGDPSTPFCSPWHSHGPNSGFWVG